MVVVAALALVIGIVLVSLALGGRGSKRNTLATVGAALIIASAVLFLISTGWVMALVALFGGWIVGSIGGSLVSSKYGGFNDIDNAIAGSKRTQRKLMKDIRKGKY